MKKLLTSLFTVIGVIAIVSTSTQAVFSDTETSAGNTFAAGSLDLNIDGGNENVIKFTLSNMRPGNQPKGTFLLSNVGSIGGKLNIKSVVITSEENDCIEPEETAGDNPNNSDGELQDVLNVRLFVDANKDGWISNGDNVFYNGRVKNLPTEFSLDQTLNAHTDVKIVALFDWWNTADDNKAMTDSFTMDLVFELVQ